MEQLFAMHYSSGLFPLPFLFPPGRHSLGNLGFYLLGLAAEVEAELSCKGDVSSSK
jgi:hypothetical protein